MAKRSYRFSLPRWALPQRENWYAAMAARGWFVQKTGSFLTRFAAGEPAQVRYRFEVGSDSGDIPQAQREFYEDCGWQYVTGDRPLHLFCAPEQADMPDLHTDPAALGDSLKAVRGAIIGQTVSGVLWAALLIAQMTYFGRYNLPMLLADAGAPLLWALFACTVFRLGWGVYSMVALVRMRRRLRAGIMPQRGGKWRALAYVHRISGTMLAAIYLVCAVVLALEYVRYHTQPLPRTGEGLPIVTLYELEGTEYRRDTAAAPTLRDDMNQLVSTWTPGAPQGFSVWEAGYTGSGQDTVYLTQKYYRLADARSAKAVGLGVLHRLWLLDSEEYTVLEETESTLILRYAEDAQGFHQTLLLFVNQEHVLFLHYWGGNAPAETIFNTVRMRFDAYLNACAP